MAALLSLSISVQAPPQLTTVIDAHAKNLRVKFPSAQGQDYSFVCTAEMAYNLLASLVKSAGPSFNNNSCSLNTANSYKPAGSNNNLNNLFARTQTMNPSELLLAAADVLARAIAKAIVSVIALPKNRQLALLPPNYQFSDLLPLSYFIWLDKPAQTVYLFGRVVSSLPPMLVLIFEKLLTAPANTLVNQQALLNIFGQNNIPSDNAWNVHMCKLRNALQPEMAIKTLKMQGYKLSINAGVLEMPYEQRCTVGKNQQANLGIQANEVETC